MTRRTYGLTIFALLVIVFLYAPIVLVMLNAFNKTEFLTHWGGFTFHWFYGCHQQSAGTAGLSKQLHHRGALRRHIDCDRSACRAVGAAGLSNGASARWMRPPICASCFPRSSPHSACSFCFESSTSHSAWCRL